MRGRQWFYHFLAERLGKSVHELKGSMGSREFESWKAYFTCLADGLGCTIGELPASSPHVTDAEDRDARELMKRFTQVDPTDGDRLYESLRSMYPGG
ncbi:MAG: hypothetical protein EPN53_00985 [Acidobacteria bacterium]|nr:MAG: hypothetical protein EPN53_00985 [Acidobacteriota bacterium]